MITKAEETAVDPEVAGSSPAGSVMAAKAEILTPVNREK